MSEMAREARLKSREKAERLTRSSPGNVDASGWREPLGELGQAQTGPRPVSRQNFRHGGKIAGLAGAMRADRKPRKSGGRTLADALINRDVKEANESREGPKHIGGMARGGHADAAEDKKLIKSEMHKAGCSCSKCSGGRVGHASGGGIHINPAHKGKFTKKVTGSKHGKLTNAGIEKGLHADSGLERKEANFARMARRHFEPLHKAAGGSLDGRIQGMRPQGGRLARKGGGAAKKGMTVNVIVAPNPPSRGAPMPPPGGLPPPGAGPLGMHQGAPPPMPPPGAAPSPGAPPPMMPRARGGRTSHMLAKPGAYPLDHASGGGLGRLEKAKAYGKNA